jgi:predicted O-methyltransferase YrrM
LQLVWHREPSTLENWRLTAIQIPPDIDEVLDNAWRACKDIPGYLVETEARFIGLAAACAPRGRGTIVEIGSYKGKSTVMLGVVAKHYHLGPVVSVDPHNFNSSELRDQRINPDSSSFSEFLSNIRNAGVSDSVEVHRAYSNDVFPTWNRQIRLLWIDGDHSYKGAKTDFDGFIEFVVAGGVVAFHDALHEFAGPIRVFVEDVLRSNQFGASGFVQSIAWSQVRPEDGVSFEAQRASLGRLANRLIPFVKDDHQLKGFAKILWKLNRSRIPRSAIHPHQWAAQLDRPKQT